jgi:hypothetical protein
MRLLPILAAVTLAMGAAPASAGAGGAYEFVAIGDVPYYVPDDYPAWERLIGAINRANPAFTVHVGDFKKGSKPCDDETSLKVLNYFDSFEEPVVYTPGDNEWTDCHRTGGDPLERLARLRQVFFSTPESRGKRKMPLTRQSQTKGYEKFSENARWSTGPVVFATVHTVGSNNNLLWDKPEAFEEFLERNRADIAWLRETFQIAKRDRSKGVVICTQANPFFEKWAEERSGFNGFIDALSGEAQAFPGQTLFIHGDTHSFRVDKPLKRGKDPTHNLMRFTRLEVMAEKDLHGIRVKVDPADPDIFSFGFLTVPENLDAKGYSK